MKVLIYSILFPALLFASITLQTHEKEWIKNHPKVIVGGEVDWAPFDFVDKNGNYTGITKDYLKLIEEKSGLKFEVETGFIWSELVEKFQKKEFDVLPAVYYLEQRESYGIHTSSYYNTKGFLFVRNSSEINSLEALKGKRLSLTKGYSSIKKIRKNYPDIIIVEYDSLLECLTAVLNNEADATFEVQAVVAYILNQNGMSGLKAVAQDNLPSHTLQMLVRKDWDILAQIISKSIDSISEEEHNKIAKKWISVNVDNSINWSIILQLIGVFSLVSLLFLYRQFVLKRHNLELKKYKVLMNLASDGILLFDSKDGSVLESNNQISNMLGYTQEELKKLTVADLDPFYSIDRFKEIIAKIENEQAIPLITKHQHKDGSLLHVSIMVNKILIDSREIVYTSIRDISESYALQKKLQEQKKEFEMMFSFSRDGIAILDLSSNFIKVNPAYAKITGYTQEELLKRSCIGMSIPEDIPRATKILEEAIKIGYIENFEKSCYRKDGTVFTINMSVTVLPNGQNFLIATKDVSEDVKLRHALIDSKEKAEVATRAKADFLANMSHEIRTPMTGLMGLIDWLKKGETDPQRIEHFQTVRNSGETLLSIINDILDFSKIESGKLELELSSVNVRSLLDVSLNIFSQLASAKNISMMGAISEDVPKCIMSDEIRLKQVIFNLIGNAIKFTEKNGTVTLQADYNNEKKSLYIAVVDTGVGIAKDNLKKIFDAFSQEDVSTTRKFGGTGLGLTISSRLVKLMGGELKAQSELMKGSKFYFEIEVETCLETDIIDSDDFIQTNDSQPLLKGCALIVEDNKTNQMLLSMILDDNGITYDIANDGAEAVLQFKYKNYDIIFMDENMPIMNGIEATALIREEESESHTPIIAITANALVEDRKRFLDAGMDDYISKPYGEDDIVRVLKKYL